MLAAREGLATLGAAPGPGGSSRGRGAETAGVGGGHIGASSHGPPNGPWWMLPATTQASAPSAARPRNPIMRRTHRAGGPAGGLRGLAGPGPGTHRHRGPHPGGCPPVSKPAPRPWPWWEKSTVPRIPRPSAGRPSGNAGASALPSGGARVSCWSAAVAPERPPWAAARLPARPALPRSGRSHRGSRRTPVAEIFAGGAKRLPTPRSGRTSPPSGRGPRWWPWVAGPGSPRESGGRDIRGLRTALAGGNTRPGLGAGRAGSPAAPGPGPRGLHARWAARMPNWSLAPMILPFGHSSGELASALLGAV
jgi:hypothetical protein